MADTATIIKLHVTNLVVDAQGKHMPTTLTLRRYVPIEKDGELKGVRWRGDQGDSEHPPRRLEIGVNAGEYIGFGRSGVVFPTSLDYIRQYPNPGAESNTSPDPELPPLVMKVANGRNISLKSLTDEAFNYQQLASLQGIAVPRCYGWFGGVLEKGMHIPGVHSQTISVLLLERMGEPMSKKWVEQDMNDLKDIIIDIAQAGIQHQDVRYSNIFQAPTATPGHNSICPVHNREHKHRLIDFELAKRSMEDPELTAESCLLRLRQGNYGPFTRMSSGRLSMPDRWENMWNPRFCR